MIFTCLGSTLAELSFFEKPGEIMNGLQGNLLGIQPIINVTSDSGPVNGFLTARTRQKYGHDANST